MTPTPPDYAAQAAAETKARTFLLNATGLLVLSVNFILIGWAIARIVEWFQ